MNSIQAKQINLPSLMQRLGYEPVAIKKGGQEYWYCSPFREESEPSFHTSFLGGKWIWNDFADQGGTVIDFIMRHENLSRVKDALSFLEAMYPTKRLLTLSDSGNGAQRSRKQPSRRFYFEHQVSKAVHPNSDYASLHTGSDLELFWSGPIQHPLIHSYLTHKRAIPRELAERYLLEVRYRHKPSGRQFFAIGIGNESGGHEIRIAGDNYGFTKSSLGKKDITLISGSKPGEGKVNVFEGMLDCLSLMAMYRVNQLKGDSIILNTVSHFRRAADFIERFDYEGINTFLDNNDSGQACTEQFTEYFGTEMVFHQNHLYEGYVDVNEALVKQIMPQQSQKGCK